MAPPGEPQGSATPMLRQPIKWSTLNYGTITASKQPAQNRSTLKVSLQRRLGKIGEMPMSLLVGR